MNNLHRKTHIFWLTVRIKYHRVVMAADRGITERWKHHARCFAALCRARSELLTPTERRDIERREGLV